MSSTRRRVAPSILLLVLPVAATLFQLLRLWSVSALGRLDFRIYYEAVDTTSHSGLYDFKYHILGLGFTYPPFTALVLRPLTLFSIGRAEHLWFILSVALCAAFAARCATLLPRANPWLKSLAAAFIIVSMPVSLTLRFGQINALVGVLILCDTIPRLERSRAGGIGLGLAAAIKLTPAYIAVVFAATTEKRRLAFTAAATAAAATLFAAIFLPGASKSYWTSVLYDTDRVGNVATSFNNSLRRIVTWLHIGGGPSTLIWLLLAAAITVVLVYRVRICLQRHNLLAAYVLASLGGYLISPISWGHHLLFIAPAVALLVGDGRSLMRWLAALPCIYVVIDPLGGGESSGSSAARILMMVLMVAFLPIDELATVTAPEVAAVPVAAP